MKSRAFLITAVTLSIVSGAALAGHPAGKSRAQVQSELDAWRNNPVSADGYRFVGGEVGYVYEGPQATATLGSGTGAGPLSREQVRRDLERFRANPVTADGYRFVGGEVGHVYEGPSRTQRQSGISGSGTGMSTAGEMSRAQVQQELREFQRNPVSPDGQWRYTGGEQGWIFIGPAH